MPDGQDKEEQLKMLKNIIAKYLRKSPPRNAADFSSLPANIIREFNRTRPQKARVNLCNAPFRNLYFATDGNVYACCYNQKFVLGKFPENSIKEIWNGETIQKLRENIKNFDLSAGCKECNAALISGQYTSAHIPFYDNYFSLAEFPTFMEFQTSNTCNLSCTMCTGDLSSLISTSIENRIPQQNYYGQEFIHQLEEFIPHLKHALFTGGEPFVTPDYYKLWDVFRKINPSCIITVQTNGTVLNDKVKDAIHKGNFNIGISLDSLKEEKYNRIRSNASLSNTLNNISFFAEYGHTHKHFTGISTCVMQQNWDEIPEIVRFCNEKDIEIYFNTVWFPGKNAIWVLDSQKIKDIVNYLSNEHFITESPLHKKNILTFKNLIKTLNHWHDNILRWEKIQPEAIDRSIIESIERDIMQNIDISLQRFFNDAGDEKRRRSNEIMTKIQSAFDLIPDNDLKLKSLKALSGYKADKVIANFYRENEEGLNLLIKNLYKLENL
jgi:radical SAM protein with 4Fe4S-binding SPASM domain